MKTMNPNKLYPYRTDACPKCGSWNLRQSTWHMARSARWLSFDAPFLHFCIGYAVDHLHMRCNLCKFAYAMATLDIRDEAAR